MATTSSFQNGFTIGESNDALVAVKLISIEHQAASGDQVDTEFNVEITITDGDNDKGKYEADITLKPGKKLMVNKPIFLGEYPNKCNHNVGEIKFKFEVETDKLIEEFIGVTTGSNALKSAGVYQFVAPVTLEDGSKKSVLIFRGRIDVSC